MRVRYFKSGDLIICQHLDYDLRCQGLTKRMAYGRLLYLIRAYKTISYDCGQDMLKPFRSCLRLVVGNESNSSNR